MVSPFSAWTAFGPRFGTLLGSFWEGIWPPRWLKPVSSVASGRPGAVSNTCWGGPEASKSAPRGQDSPRGSPRGVQELFLRSRPLFLRSKAGPKPLFLRSRPLFLRSKDPLPEVPSYALLTTTPTKNSTAFYTSTSMELEVHSQGSAGSAKRIQFRNLLGTLFSALEASGKLLQTSRELMEHSWTLMERSWKL